jgi:hypothetical protein
MGSLFFLGRPYLPPPHIEHFLMQVQKMEALALDSLSKALKLCLTQNRGDCRCGRLAVFVIESLLAALSGGEQPDNTQGEYMLASNGQTQICGTDTAASSSFKYTSLPSQIESCALALLADDVVYEAVSIGGKDSQARCHAALHHLGAERFRCGVNVWDTCSSTDL